MRKILTFAAVTALTFGIAAPAQAVEAPARYDCAGGSINWNGWSVAPDLKVAGNYCPGNGYAATEGSWAAWDKSSNGLCAEIWVAPSATAAFQRVPGTKACGINVVRSVSNDPVPLSYVARARVVETLVTCPPAPRSCWADAGHEFFRTGYDPEG